MFVSKQANDFSTQKVIMLIKGIKKDIQLRHWVTCPWQRMFSFVLVNLQLASLFRTADAFGESTLPRR